MGYPRVFGATYFESKDPNEIVETHIARMIEDGGLLESISEVNHKELITLLHTHLFSKLHDRGWERIENVEWQLIEYYGLASTAIDNNGPFHPTVSQTTKALLFKTKDNKKWFHYFVRIGGWTVLTFIEEP